MAGQIVVGTALRRTWIGRSTLQQSITRTFSQKPCLWLSQPKRWIHNSSFSRQFTKIKPEKPTQKDLKYYIQNGGSCTLYSGIAIYVVALPTCYQLAKYGVADWILSGVRNGLDYCGENLGSRVVGKAQNACSGVGKTVQTWMPSISDKSVEWFVMGYVLYFMLKPVRYGTWIYLIRACMQRKQLAKNAQVTSKQYKAHKEYIKKQPHDLVMSSRARIRSLKRPNLRKGSQLKAKLPQRRKIMVRLKQQRSSIAKRIGRPLRRRRSSKNKDP